jgi:hypothetical protein
MAPGTCRLHSDKNGEAMNIEAPALLAPTRLSCGCEGLVAQRCGSSICPIEQSSASRAVALEQASELLTELLDPYAGPLDGCEWHIVSAARQVIWRLVREVCRDDA